MTTYPNAGLCRRRWTNLEERIAWAPAGAASWGLRRRATPAGFLNGLGIASFHYIGTSLGGMVAMALALEAPECQQSLMLNDIDLNEAQRVVNVSPILSARARMDLLQSRPMWNMWCLHISLI